MSGTVFSIILLVATVIGIIIARRNLKKEGPGKVDKLYDHMRSMGIKVSRAAEDVLIEGAGENNKRPRNSLELLKIAGKQIDFVRLTGEAQQYGVTYYLDFLVKRNRISPGQKVSTTRLQMKKSSMFSNQIEGLYWKGDPVLAQKLNDDYRLHDILLRADRKSIKGGITIYPDLKKPYARIRMAEYLLEPETFNALDTIAGYIKRSY